MFPMEEKPILEGSVDLSKVIKRLVLTGSLISFLNLTKPILPSFDELLRGKTLGPRSDFKDWIIDKSKEDWEDAPLPVEKGDAVYLPILRSKVQVTAYTPDPRETDDDPFTASCGKYDHVIESGLYVFALSRDLFFNKELQKMFGKYKPLCGLPAIVRLPDGTELKGVVMDTMAKFTSSGKPIVKAVDVLHPPEWYGGNLRKAKQAALEFGRKHEADLVVLLPAKTESYLDQVSLLGLKSILDSIRS